MFDKAVSWVKAHPYTAGGVALGSIAIVLLFTLRGAGGGGGGETSSASSGPSEALQAAAINAQAQTQSAQIAAGAANAQRSSELELGKATLAAQIEIARFGYEYGYENNLIDSVENIAINAPVITTESGSNGITLPFGLGQIGGSRKTTQTQPGASSSLAALQAIIARNQGGAPLTGGQGSGTGSSGSNN